MSSSHVDRNLLFGILALQMDFISRDALIAAMHAWVLDKQKPLGQILVEQGALAPDAQAVLDALVKKHLELHHGDPQQSLAAVGLPGAVQRDLAQFADADVKASLVHLAAIAPAKPSQQTTLPMVTPASLNARFEILRSHAWGGLGEVYVAQDREVNREVALKRLHERYADDTGSRARFLREAEITGGLEHPGIVPVYGLGISEDGRPHYAMRFIRGETLKAAIERFHAAVARTESERRIELRQLLARFIAVCNAVEYAHSRGVIHRDLKPSNIMLGKYGETLVVDWGLCKALGYREPEAAADEHTLIPSSGSGSSETLPGSAIGTPAYMSPEQSEGRIDDMGPASDVYSLGATLYTILTGSEPFESTNVGVILGKVQAGEFVPPRERARGVPRALDAVCLKAMSLMPKDRYPSCAALASDIEHWLADEPVTALRDPFLDRTIRWIKRHRVLAAASAAILVAAFFSLVIGNVLLGRANSQIRDAVTDAQRQRDEARQQRTRAEENFRQTRQAMDRYFTAQRQRDEARREQTLAEKNFRQTRQAIGRYFTLLSESRLIDVQGAEPLRKELLRAALEYYQKFPKVESDDAEVQGDLAAAYFRMSQIQNVTGAGDWLPMFKKGLEIVERLIASKAPPDKFEGFEAGVFDVAGQTLHVDPRFVPDVKQALARSIAAWEKLSSMQPKSKGLRNDLAAMYCVLGVLKGDIGLEFQARDQWAKLATEYPDETRFRAALVVQNANIAQLQMRRREYGAALATLLAADASAQRLVYDYPNISRYREDASRVNLSTIMAYFALHDVSHGVDAAQKQISVCEKLVADFPTVPTYRQNLRSMCETVFFEVWETFPRLNQLKDFTAAFELYARLQDLIETQLRSPIALGPNDQLFGQFLAQEDAQPRLSFPLPSRHLGETALAALKRLYETSPKTARTELLNEISDHPKPGRRTGQKTYRLAEVALRWWAGEREAAVKLLETFAREMPDDAEFRLCLVRARTALDRSGKESDPSLERSLGDREVGIRIAAAQRLWSRNQKPDQVLPALVGCLGETNAANRTAAVKTLGMMGPRAKNALAALRPLLDDPVSDVRVAVVEAFWKIDHNATLPPREFRFRVVTRAGQPVVRATVQACAIRCGRETPITHGPLGTLEFDGKFWGCPATTTDSQGMVRVTLAVKRAGEGGVRFSAREFDSVSDYCRELEALGIDEIALRVDHPDHPIWSSFIKVAAEGRLVLSDATTLVIHAHRGNEQASVGQLYPAFGSPSGLPDENGRDYLKDMDWFEKNGALEIHRLDLASQHASRWLRIIHVPNKGPAWFSDLIDLKQIKNNLVSIEIPLRPGVRVEGRLSEAIPRPVQNGTIVAKIVAAANEPSPWEWDATTTIDPDGTFLLESLPADENLQLVALSDGGVSVSPKQAQVREYAKKHGLLGLLHYLPNTDSVYPQFYRLEGPVIHPVIAMERTSSCKVSVLDQDGKPISDAHVTFFPEQMFYNSAATTLGTRFDGLGHVQAQLAYQDHSEGLEVKYGYFRGTTDEDGVATASGLPARNLKSSVQLQGYKMAFANVKLLPGQTAHVTVRMKRE